jgi:hypothetical protein
MGSKRQPARAKEPKPLSEGSWAGHTNYECTRCGFKSLDREAALEHILNKHAIKEAAE